MSDSIIIGGAQSGRRAGIVSMAINALPIDCKGEAAYLPNIIIAETIVSQDAALNYKEKAQAGYISFTALDAGGTSVASLGGARNASVVLVTSTGKTVSGDRLWCTECSEVNTEEGTFKLKFEGVVTEAPV